MMPSNNNIAYTTTLIAEIPLELSVSIYENPKWRFYAKAGGAYNIILNGKYSGYDGSTASYTLFDAANTQNTSLGNADNASNNFWSLGVGVGIERRISKRCSIFVEPCYRESQKGFGLQETRYANTNGYYNLNLFYTYSKPIQNRKYVFNYGGTVNYNNNISFLNFEKNKGKNIILSQRLSMDYKLKKWLETSGGAVFTLNDNKSSLAPLLVLKRM